VRPTLFSALNVPIKLTTLTLFVMNMSFIFCLRINRRPRFYVLQINVVRGDSFRWDTFGRSEIRMESYFLFYWLIHCWLVTVEGFLP
jgi:hypothetical protein